MIFGQELKKDTSYIEQRFGLVKYTNGTWLENFLSPDTIHHAELNFKEDSTHREFVRYAGYQGQVPIILDAGLPMYFHPKFLNTSFSYYKYTLDNAKRYYSKSPYTSISYILGTPKHQQLKLDYAQHILRKFFVTLQYHRISATGPYQRNTAGIHNLHTNIWYRSPESKHEFQFRYIYNALKQEENGGIHYQNFVNGLYLRSTIPITLDAALRSQSENIYHLSYNYNLLKIDTANILKTKLKLGGYIQYSSEKFAYKDTEPIANFYPYFYFGNAATYDTSYFKNFAVGPRIWWQHALNNHLDMSAGFTRNSMLVKQYDLSGVLERWRSSKMDYYYFDAIASLKIGSRQQGLLQAEYKQAVAGYNQGDQYINVQAVYNHKYFVINSGYKQNYKTSDLFFVENYDNHHVWNYTDSTLKRSFGYELSGQLLFNQWPLRIGLINGLVTNYNYLQEELQVPVFLSKPLSYIKLALALPIKIKKFHLEPEVIYQSHDGLSMPWPRMLAKFTGYWESSFLNGATIGKFGIAARYSSTYRPWRYSPSIGSFYYEDDVLVSDMPELNVFIQFSIKRAELYFKGNFLNQGWPQWGYYVAPRMPSYDRNFQFGVRWDFYD